MTGQETPAAAPTVLDALRGSPIGPVLDMPLPASPVVTLPPPDPGLNSIVELLQSIPVPQLPGIDQFLAPLTDLGGLFGTGILDALDPAAILHQSSRFLDTAVSIGRGAVDALPDSWEGAPAEAAVDHGRQAQASAVELSERGDRIGELTRAATATVERGNIELSGIAQSFVAVATAAAPVALTPPGQALLVSSAVEHLQAALAVVARSRGELSVHTVAMNTLTAPIPVPPPIAPGALPDAGKVAAVASDAVKSLASDTASALGPMFGGTGDEFAPTRASSAVPTVPSAGGVGPMSSPAGVGVAGVGGSGIGPGSGAIPAAAVGGILPGPAAPGATGAATPVAAAAGRGMYGGIPAAGAARGDDKPDHRSTPGFLVSAANSTEVVGELPQVVPSVIGGADDGW
ncbi:MAG: hypothetical protein WAX14_24095 [Rhodococcus sp. (in: high G+C Gram-positive bacteria)]|uniref:hypothetical protein n=1 Tax=Rhodococcus sp. TaxID=1831 RepID=UPI003BB6BAD7